MKHVDLSNALAAEMSRVLNSDENKELFSSSSMLEKLAFKKVSEDDAKTEIEAELESQGLLKQASKTSSCIRCYEQKPDSTGVCKCECKGPADCAKGCPCKCGGGAYAKSLKTSASVKDAVEKLLAVSEQLDNIGFEKLAAASILLVDRLVTEAAAKSSKKSDKKTEKSKESEKSKSKGKKVDMKDRMKKMREMQKGKGKAKKDSKKSSKDKK